VAFFHMSKRLGEFREAVRSVDDWTKLPGIGESGEVLAVVKHRDYRALSTFLVSQGQRWLRRVEVVVTERGVADLRGLSRAERRAALADLWDFARA
jgi:hypothetical protein